MCVHRAYRLHQFTIGWWSTHALDSASAELNAPRSNEEHIMHTDHDAHITSHIQDSYIKCDQLIFPFRFIKLNVQQHGTLRTRPFAAHFTRTLTTLSVIQLTPITILQNIQSTINRSAYIIRCCNSSLADVRKPIRSNCASFHFLFLYAIAIKTRMSW